MILLVTNERDLTTDYVVLELQRRQVPYVRLNTERMADTRVVFRPETSGNWEITVAGHVFRLADVTSGYFRRPASPIAPAGVKGPQERRYCEDEWTAVLQSIYSALGCRWLNSPADIFAAEDKPRQLALARSLDFQIPETVVTNELRAAMEFADAGPTVAKPLRAALLESPERPEGERVIFTSRLADLRRHSREAVEAAPVIFQREIEKESDIRVTVVGQRVFAASIASQASEDTSVDWRRGSSPAIAHAVHELPSVIAQKCVQVVRRLNLRFGAVDLVRDRRGDYWFLEVNPNGQWAWIQNRTGLPITAAIVDELLVLPNAFAQDRS